MTEVLRLHASDGKPDLIMLFSEEQAFTADVEKDKKGEFIILPEGFRPQRKKHRKIYLMQPVEAQSK